MISEVSVSQFSKCGMCLFESSVGRDISLRTTSLGEGNVLHSNKAMKSCQLPFGCRESYWNHPAALRKHAKRSKKNDPVGEFRAERDQATRPRPLIASVDRRLRHRAAMCGRRLPPPISINAPSWPPTSRRRARPTMTHKLRGPVAAAASETAQTIAALAVALRKAAARARLTSAAPAKVSVQMRTERLSDDIMTPRSVVRRASAARRRPKDPRRSRRCLLRRRRKIHPRRHQTGIARHRRKVPSRAGTTKYVFNILFGSDSIPS